MDCLNLNFKDNRRLVNDFGEINVSNLLNEHFVDKNPNYDEFIANKDVLKAIGALSKSESNKVLGTSYGKEISESQSINLKKKISLLNNSLFKSGEKTVYMLFNNRQIGQSYNFTWGLRKVEGRLNVNEKIERAKEYLSDKKATAQNQINYLESIKDKNVNKQSAIDFSQTQQEPEVKPGVSELFDSSPELANAVYEALGVEVNKYIDKKYYDNYNKLLKLFNEGKNLNVLNNISFNIINAPNNIKEKYQVATTIKEKIWEDDILGEFKDFSDSVFLKIKYDEKYGTFDLFKSTKFNEFGKEYELIEEDLSYDIIKKLLSYSSPALTYMEEQAKITLQQKQQAQQKFQEYVDTTGKQDIEGFKEFVNK